MVGSKTLRSSVSSISTWSSNGTWAVRPIFTKKPDSSSPQTSTPANSQNDDSATVKAKPNFVSPQDQIPATPLSFKWIRGDLIGSGSYGKVYWALNVTTGEIIAVKQVEKLGLSPSKHERDSIDALKSEYLYVKDLGHPNVVEFLGFEENVDHLCIFMEYVAGGSIGSCLVAHGKFDQEVTKAFTGQILDGLEYLHSKGIIHRDIKADNVLVDKSGVCKISDFGISKRIESDATAAAKTSMQGTIFWMAPEVINAGEGKGYNYKIDIWSVGCVVTEMWTGRRPFFGQDLYPVLLKLYKEKLPPPLPSDLILSNEALDFRNKAFSKNPKERPSAAELRSHPYLMLSPGWSFNPSYIEGPGDFQEKEHTVRRVRSTSTLSHTFRRLKSGSKKILPPVPSTPPPVPPSRNVPSYPSPPPTVTSNGPVQLQASNSSPSLPSPRPLQSPNNLSQMNPAASSPTLSSPTPMDESGPPIVWITPPSSPVPSNPPQQLQFSDDTISSPSTTSSSRWSSRRNRSFHVANPDPDPDSLRPSRFIYNPPPLPELSNRLSMHPRRVPSTPVLRTQPLSASTSRSRHASTFADVPSTFRHPEDEDGDIGYTERQKSPRNKRDSAWARPFPEDIFEHLQEFFPNHDVDRPFLEETGSTPQDERGVAALKPKKSIRMVAQQQAKRSQRKAKGVTALWGSHLEELGSMKPPP